MHTHNPGDYKSQALGKGFRWLRLVFMVFYDWIQLFGAAQGSKRRSQFGRLAYWQMVLHPSSNQYVLFLSLQMFTQESGLRMPLSPGSSGYYKVFLPAYYTTSPPSSIFSLPIGMTFWPSAQKQRSPLSQKVHWDMLPPSSRAAKSSNQTRHPSLSCGVE